MIGKSLRLVAALALALGLVASVGAAGKRADIIVVNGNPLFDINVLGYVERVIKGGVVYK